MKYLKARSAYWLAGEAAANVPANHALALPLLLRLFHRWRWRPGCAPGRHLDALGQARVMTWRRARAPSVIILGGSMKHATANIAARERRWGSRNEKFIDGIVQWCGIVAIIILRGFAAKYMSEKAAK